MKVQEIISNSNEQYKQLLKLKQKKYRYQEAVFLIEGIKFVKHAILQGADLKAIAFTNNLLGEEIIAEIVQMLETSNANKEINKSQIKLFNLSKNLFEALSDTVNSQGILAVVSFPEPIKELDPTGLYLALDRIQDPGNLGTMIRTADAAGFSGIILSKGTVDPFSEKVLRSTMGSIFTLPILQTESLEQTLIDGKALGLSIYTTALENSIDYTQGTYKSGTVFVIGNEAQGISDSVFALSDQRITIPIMGHAESLNAAVAAAIVMYEAVNQRRSL